MLFEDGIVFGWAEYLVVATAQTTDDDLVLARNLSGDSTADDD
jgi:hypothetical protein